MRVCEVSDFGGPDVLRVATRPWPVASPDEVVVQIGAANVNPTDIAARDGTHRRRMPDLQPPFVLGWDLAGVVSDVGASVSAFAVGDPVVGIIPWVRIGGRVGAYAQAAVCEPGWLAPRPESVDVVTGATVPLNALTARQALDLIGASPGSTILVTGASGAVGSFAVQLAVADGLRVVALASSDDEEWVSGLGASEVLSRGTDLSSVGPVDAVLDAVPLGVAALAPLRPGGVAVFTRRIADLLEDPGVRIETPLVQPDQAALVQLTREVAAGRLRTRVARTVALAEAAEAHRLAERGGLRGKVVLEIEAD